MATTSLESRWERSQILAEEWMTRTRHSQAELAGSLGVDPAVLCRYLDNIDSVHKPHLRRPRMMAILEGIERICPLHGEIPLNHELALELGEHFPHATVTVVARESRHLLEIQCACMVDQNIDRLLWQKGMAVFGFAGGATLDHMIPYFGRHVRHKGKLTVVPLNSAKGRYPTHAQAKSVATRYENAICTCECDLDPDVVLTSAGMPRHGYAMKVIESCRRKVVTKSRKSSKVAGDANCNPVSIDGEQATGEDIELALNSLDVRLRYEDLKRLAAKPNTTLILALTDATYDDQTDNPPNGRSKVRAALACMRAEVANQYVITEELAKLVLTLLRRSRPRKPR